MNKMFEVEGGKSNILKGWKNRLREDIHRLLPEKYGDIALFITRSRWRMPSGNGLKE